MPVLSRVGQSLPQVILRLAEGLLRVAASLKDISSPTAMAKYRRCHEWNGDRTPIRLKNSAELNANLYKIFILPLYRLSLINSTNEDRTACETYVRKSFKRFMNWPINTNNILVERHADSVADKALGAALQRARHESN